jgi:hypothetical protein
MPAGRPVMPPRREEYRAGGARLTGLRADRDDGPYA